MTCFWDGILWSLHPTDLNVVLGFGLQTRPPITDFVTALAQHASMTPNVTWKGASISEREQIENLAHVQNLQLSLDGYDCAACEPVMVLVCELFRVELVVQTPHGTFTYKHPESRARLRFGQWPGHFEYLAS